MELLEEIAIRTTYPLSEVMGLRITNVIIEKVNYIQPIVMGRVLKIQDFGILELNLNKIFHNFCPKILPYLQGYSKVEYENMTKFGVV